MKYTFTIEGTDGLVYGYGQGTVSDFDAQTALELALELMEAHNPTNDMVGEVETLSGTEYRVEVNNSDDYYVVFSPR